MSWRMRSLLWFGSMGSIPRDCGLSRAGPESGFLSAMNHPEPLLLYDGACGVCNAAVQFVLRRDRDQQFLFVALESPTGRRLLDSYGVFPVPDSLVLLDRGQAMVRSAAVFGVLRRLGGVWHLLQVGRVVPRAWADAGYDWFARRRGRISARLGLASCPVPTPADRARFLD